MKSFKAKAGQILVLAMLSFLFGMVSSNLYAQTIIQIGENYNFTQAPSSTEAYQIELQQPGEFTIHLNNWISTLNWSVDYDRLYIYNSNGDPIGRNEFSTVDDPFLFHMFQGNTGLVFRIGQAGTYTIMVHSGQRWGDNWNNVTIQNYELSVTALFCNDDHEKNDDIASATPISIGSTINAYQWRQTNTTEVTGDEDWYMVNLETPGMLRLELVDWVAIYNWGADYDRLWVYNGDGVSIGFAGGNEFYGWMMGGGTPEEPFVIEMNLTHAGNYYLRFHAGSATSTIPYQLTTSFTPADDPFEPNDDFTTAKQIINSDEWYQAYEWRSIDSTMNVAGDEDFYYFEAAGASEFSLSLDGWIPIFNWGADYDRLYIYDENENPVGESPYSWMMGTDPIIFSVPSEGRYYLRLHCGWAYSIEGYQFKLSGSFYGIGNEDKELVQFTSYPNPASDQLVVEIDQQINEHFTLRVFNTMGMQYYSEIIKQNTCRIDCSKWNNGIYFIEIESEAWKGTKKFIIQR